MKQNLRENFDEAVDAALDHLEINEKNIAFFLQVLKETNNISFWLILPLDLAETHDERLVPILIDLLQDPRTVNYRGNFLSALHEYDYLPYADLLVNFLCDSNWELRTKAAEMLLEIKDRLTEDTLRKLEKRVHSTIYDMDDRYTMMYDIADEFHFQIEDESSS